jgi:hypothetical protein
MNLPDLAAKRASACGRPQGRRVRITDSLPTTQSDVQILLISAIRRDGQTQHRVAIDPSIIAEYASLMREGVSFPPVRVWWDGSDYWLSDGFQRVSAAEIAGRTQIAAKVLHGTLSDAQWDSYAANAAHGSRHSWAETQIVIRLALKHSNSAAMSNVQIAKHLHLSEATVRRGRKTLSSSPDEDSGRIVTRGKATYLLTTTNIGKTSGDRQTRPRRDLRAEIAEMKEKGSPTTCRLLNIIGRWALGEATPARCIDAIERFIRNCHAPDEPAGMPQHEDSLALETPETDRIRPVANVHV